MPIPSTLWHVIVTGTRLQKYLSNQTMGEPVLLWHVLEERCNARSANPLDALLMGPTPGPFEIVVPVLGWQVMTLEGWPDVARAATDVEPWVWCFGTHTTGSGFESEGTRIAKWPGNATVHCALHVKRRCLSQTWWRQWITCLH